MTILHETVFHEDTLTALFCQIDDFCNAHPSPAPTPKRHRHRSLCQSEIITLLVAYQQSQFRTFKAFYQNYVCRHWQPAFPRLVSYSRFLEFIPSVLSLLSRFLSTLLCPTNGLCFLDSTPLAVCHNRRIKQHTE